MGEERKKILVAEDDPASARILEFRLKEWGYEVILVPDGLRGWETFQADPDINLIISDWMMPNMDGIEFCKLVRGFKDRRYTYFLLLTAKAQTEDIVEGLEAGADDFIPKPFNKFELKVRISAGERILDLEGQLADKVDELSNAYKQLRRSLSAAATMQRSILPPKTGTLNGLAFSSSYIPSEDLGGDMFNIVELMDDYLGIYIFDVSGHGVPAALQSVALGRMLNPYEPRTSLLLKQENDDDQIAFVPPNVVVTRLNMQFQSSASKGDFITFLYGVLQRSTGIFTYTRAGHPGPVHISNGKIRLNNDRGDIPIGIIPDYEYTHNTLQLSTGDRLYFFTDGIPEAANAEGNRFGDNRMTKLFVECSDSTLEESIKLLRLAVIDWTGKPASDDDMSIFGVELQA